MVRILFARQRSRKASKEEQGRKSYNDDAEERHLVGLKGTGQSAQAEEYRLGVGPFYKKIPGLYSQGTLVVPFSDSPCQNIWVYSLYGRRPPNLPKKEQMQYRFDHSCHEFCVPI